MGFTSEMSKTPLGPLGGVLLMKGKN